MWFRVGCLIFLQSPGVLAAVDATEHKAVGERFKISGFPSLKYFVNGEEKYTLSQLRSKDKIIEFMHKWVMQFDMYHQRCFPAQLNCMYAYICVIYLWVYLCCSCFTVVNKDNSPLFLQSSSPPSARAVLGGQALWGQPSWLRGLSRRLEKEKTCPGHVLRPL